MIGKISGRLDYRAADHVLIDTGGIGYLVHCSERTLAAMPAPGEPVALYTDLLVREDLMQLIGFLTRGEREVYRLLTTVQGVGAKAALAILGSLGPDGVARALLRGDVAAIQAAPGVGPKIAQRVMLELKAKAPAVMEMGGAGAAAAFVPSIGAGRVASASAPMAGAQERADALSALVNLGYAPGEAASAVAEADAGGEDAPALIRAALRLLAPKG